MLMRLVRQLNFRLLLLFLSLLFSPWSSSVVQAGLTATDTGGDLYLSCTEDDECVLTPTPIGEEQISGQSTANTFQTETIRFEFTAMPPQEHVALLPDVIRELQIDFRHQTEFGGVFKPQLEIRLILGQNVNQWSFDATVLPQTDYSPYRLENEALSLDEGRVMWTDQPIRLIVIATLDRPGTWELNMRGVSFVKMDIPWSLSPSSADVDEPTSNLEPQSTVFEDVHRGALVGRDDDCWNFEVETHEVLRLIVEWENVPIEVEQSHATPDLLTAAGRNSPVPEILIDDDGEIVKITYRWRALPVGDYTMCMHGSSNKIQSYTWSGLFGYESMGPISPSGFGLASYYPRGAAILGDADNPTALHAQSASMLVASLLMLGVFLLVALRPTTSHSLRFGFFVPGVIFLLIGGVIHPLWVFADQIQGTDELTLEDLLEMRLQQLWDVSYDGVPDQTLYTHAGATWGMLDGEKLQLILNIEEAIPLPDGRWQLVVPELESLRLDHLIFSQVSKAQIQQSQDGMLESQTIRFVLLAGRSLLLDLLMLEALLVVDEPPSSSVIHIDTMMIQTQSAGSFAAPAWATRPSSISTEDWVRLQSSLFPDRISVSLCDCDLDLLDVTFTKSKGFDVADMPQDWGIASAEGLTAYGSVLMWSGVVLGGFAAFLEHQRVQRARTIASSYRGDHRWQ